MLSEFIDDIEKYLNTYRQVRKITKELYLEEELGAEPNDLEKYLDYSKDIYKYIGNGTTRIVFDVGKYILKIALHSWGTESNLAEYKLYNEIHSKDKLLSDKFAKALYISKGGMCLVMEKMNPLIVPITDKEIDELFENIYDKTGYAIEDLSQDNIMIDKDNKWKIVDYGMYGT